MKTANDYFDQVYFFLKPHFLNGTDSYLDIHLSRQKKEPYHVFHVLESTFHANFVRTFMQIEQEIKYTYIKYSLEMG